MAENPETRAQRLADLLLQSNAHETGARLPNKFTGREARLLADWLLAHDLLSEVAALDASEAALTVSNFPELAEQVERARAFLDRVQP